MALPLIPFLLGAAAGSVLTYLYKDKDAREALMREVRGAASAVGAAAKGTVVEKPKTEVLEEAGESEAPAAEAAGEVKEGPSAEPKVDAEQKSPEANIH